MTVSPASGPTGPRGSPAGARTGIAGGLAVLAWVLLCLRWFDPARAGRPSWLEAVPAAVLAALLLACGAAWFWSVREGFRAAGPSPGLWLVLAATLLFRLPMVVQGAAGYVTADGALSGLMALHVRDGVSHPVFVESVPYSGSLKAHLVAPLAAVLDPARAFALVSVLFYVAFVGGLYRLAQAVDPEDAFTPSAAGLYAAFAPPFVTRYSLSNDGNYVEVLALGTWALVLAVRWIRSGTDGRLAVGMGLLLGLAFWCHILAVMHALTLGLVLLAADARRGLRNAPALLAGFGLGYLPGLLWNAAHGWESFAYLRPGTTGTEGGPGLGERLTGLVADHLPVLLGYDPGYPAAWDIALRSLAAVASAVALWSIVQAVREAARTRSAALGVVLAFAVVSLALALVALPYIPGNPRYLLFLMASLPILLARLLRTGWRRGVLAGIVAFGALGSLAQLPGTARSDGQWRSLARGLEAEGVRWCYTDFFLATKVNFLAEEKVICSAKLGPTTTEYFHRYREAVERAPEAALIAVNATNAEKLERRLDRLGVRYERRDLMKPLLLRLSRKVDPEELFPDREFPAR